MAKVLKTGAGKGLTPAQYGFARGLAGTVSRTMNPKNHGYGKRK